MQLVDGVAKQTEFNGLRITQIPVNINDATTGHKLQGMSKDMLIIVSWGYAFVNWVYTVLSCVCTFEGLFLFGLFEHDFFYVNWRSVLYHKEMLEWKIKLFY